MEKRKWRVAAVASSAMAILTFMARPGQAIPSNDTHSHAPGSVTWSQAPIPPSDPNTTNHQHNSALDIRGGNGSYDAYAAWDSERALDGPRDMWRYPVGAGNAPALGVEGRVFGHGYIADDFVSAIEYAFVGPGWNADSKALVNAAFAMWETEAKTRPNGSVVGEGGALVRKPGTQVGINFDEDTLLTQTNFEIRWANIGGPDLAATWYPDDSPVDVAANDLELVFNSGALFNNAGQNAEWTSLPEANEWDFFSVALHEVGHVLGLHHFAAGDGTNLMSAAAASFGIGETHRFIDTADLQGAIDLYSIPEPASVMFMAFGAMVALRRKTRRSDAPL